MLVSVELAFLIVNAAFLGYATLVTLIGSYPKSWHCTQLSMLPFSKLTPFSQKSNADM